MSAPPFCDGLLALACIAAGAANSGEPPADISLREAIVPGRVRVDRPVTIGYEVRNAGPATADEVALKIPLGEPWRVTYASAGAGSCAGTRAIYCNLGSIPAGGQVNVTVGARPQATGNLHPRGGLTSGTADPNPEDNFSNAAVTVFDPFTGILPENAKVNVRDNAFRLRYGCPASIPKYCRGNVEVDYQPSNSTPAGQPPMVLGAARLSYPSGVAGRVRIRLNGEAIALFKKSRVVRVLTVTTVRDGAGTRATRTAPLTLVGPKPKEKKPKKKKP